MCDLRRAGSLPRVPDGRVATSWPGRHRSSAACCDSKRSRAMRAGRTASFAEVRAGSTACATFTRFSTKHRRHSGRRSPPRASNGPPERPLGAQTTPHVKPAGRTEWRSSGLMLTALGSIEQRMQNQPSRANAYTVPDAAVRRSNGSGPWQATFQRTVRPLAKRWAHQAGRRPLGCSYTARRVPLSSLGALVPCTDRIDRRKA